MFQVVSEPPASAKNGPVTVQVAQTVSSVNDKGMYWKGKTVTSTLLLLAARKIQG